MKVGSCGRLRAPGALLVNVGLASWDCAAGTRGIQRSCRASESQKQPTCKYGDQEFQQDDFQHNDAGMLVKSANGNSTPLPMVLLLVQAHPRGENRGPAQVADDAGGIVALHDR